MLQSKSRGYWEQQVFCGHCGDRYRRKHLKGHLEAVHPGCVWLEAIESDLERIRAQWQEKKQEEAEERERVRKLVEQQRLETLRKEREAKREAERVRILEETRMIEKMKEEEKQRQKERRKKKLADKNQAIGSKVQNDTNLQQEGPSLNSQHMAEHNYFRSFAALTLSQQICKVAAKDAMPVRNTVQWGGSCPNLPDIGSSSITAEVTTESQVQESLVGTSQSFRRRNSTSDSLPHLGWSYVREPTEADVRLKVHGAKSVDELLAELPNFSYDPVEGKISCRPCDKNFQTSKSITYRHNESDSESRKATKFRELRKKVLGHMYDSAQHKSAVKVEENCRKPKTDAVYLTGLSVGRAVIAAQKLNLSHNDTETLLAMKAADGVPVGDINHGATFFSSMTTPCYDSLKDRISSKLKKALPGTGRPPGFAVIADKVTPKGGTTLQNIGIVSSLDNGKLHATMIAVDPCHISSGRGTAKEIKAALREWMTDKEIRERFVGGAFDGAYIRNNIKEHLLAEFGIPEEHSDAYAFHWDPAHMIELASKDSRGQTSSNRKIQVPWLRDTYDTMVQVGSNYGFGSKWTQIQNEAVLLPSKEITDSQSMDGKPKKFRSPPDTRFATYFHDTVSAVRENYEVIYNAMEKNNDKDLKKIKNPDFVLQLCGLEDYQRVVGDASRKVQSPRLYPWNVQETMDDLTDRLDKMSSGLSFTDSDLLATSGLTTFAKAHEEVTTRGTYCGKSLNTAVNNHGKYRFMDESNRVRKDLAENINIFNDKLRERVENTKEGVTELTRDIFSMEAIKSRPEGEPPESLHSYFELQKKAGFLAPSTTFPEIKQEYSAFVSTVHQADRKIIRHDESFISKEEQIYSRILTDTSTVQSFPRVAHLLGNACSQTFCEAVTEGWASVIKTKLAKKANLGHENLSQEVFLKLNAPKPTKKADSLIAEALDRRFGNRHNWHFFRSSPNSKLKQHQVSKVIDKVARDDCGFPFSSSDDSN